MSERLDILRPAIAQLPFFTVDTGAATVPIAYPQNPSYILYNAEGYSIFSQGDHFTVLSMGFLFPLSFQLDRSNASNPYIEAGIFAHGRTSGEDYRFKEISGLGGTGVLFFPVENYEVIFDVYINVNNQDPNNGHYLSDEAYELFIKLAVADLEVSMVGVPGSLDGTVQLIYPFAKILHNTPLSMAP